ncbi:hypothetical protein BU24DRAFT_448623 [Aaosphaeria arxii CBS 175.79]|uniref:Uncharacterized protein n=1 Tax=Aaosphaeria arxii CBS 175.79 TaxID=1450172 RepID=A0A6A5Y5P3_9PLEO|nr:uncharacterized protein BU24DRAFT_448623 [Aaosphaeria arxii CBS 175.79]KAF2020337.1 hypothetical protein BU24DRAFT_448623 [Aaosphaeria arxii CBS 175.79]
MSQETVEDPDMWKKVKGVKYVAVEVAADSLLTQVGPSVSTKCQLEESSNELAGFQEEVTGLKEEMTELKEAPELKSEVTKLEEVTELEGNLTKFKEKAIEPKTEVTDLKGGQIKLEEKVTDLKEKVTELRRSHGGYITGRFSHLDDQINAPERSEFAGTQGLKRKEHEKTTSSKQKKRRMGEATPRSQCPYDGIVSSTPKYSWIGVEASSTSEAYGG